MKSLLPLTLLGGLRPARRPQICIGAPGGPFGLRRGGERKNYKNCKTFVKNIIDSLGPWAHFMGPWGAEDRPKGSKLNRNFLENLSARYEISRRIQWKPPQPPEINQKIQKNYPNIMKKMTLLVRNCSHVARCGNYAAAAECEASAGCPHQHAALTVPLDVSLLLPPVTCPPSWGLALSCYLQ